jgi:structural maintenance of chromosomes protein 6
MPTKRRAASVETDSEVDASQPQKRARTAEDSEVEINDAPQASGSRSSGDKKRGDIPIEIDEDEEEIRQDVPDEDEEKRFEREHEDAIRAKVYSGHRGLGVRNNLVSTDTTVD